MDMLDSPASRTSTSDILDDSSNLEATIEGEELEQERKVVDVSVLTPYERYRCFVWLTLDDPSSSQIAQYVSVFMMLTIMLSIAAMTFASIPENMIWVDVWASNETGEVIKGSLQNETYPDSMRNTSPRLTCDEVDESRTPFREIEIFCICVFTIEYLLRAWSSPPPAGPGYLGYFIAPANLVDLASIMPFYIELVFDLIGRQGNSNLDVLSVLRLIRLTRVTRIFKMSKNFQGLAILAATFRKSAAALLMLFLFMLIFSILFATLIYTVEGGTWDAYRRQYVRPDGSLSPFESIPVSMWWTIVTMCTVGYGDQYPVTPLGKVIAIFTMFCGLIVLSLPITIIGANFNLEYRELTQRQHRDRAKEKRKEEQTSKRLPDDAADAIHLIHEIIDKSHEDLKIKVMRALYDRENRLRRDIKQLLASYNEQINQLSPLEEVREYDKRCK